VLAWFLPVGGSREENRKNLRLARCSLGIAKRPGFDASLVLSRVQCPALDCSSPVWLLQELLDVTWYNMTCDA
jgi:hypothetical protein